VGPCLSAQPPPLTLATLSLAPKPREILGPKPVRQVLPKQHSATSTAAPGVCIAPREAADPRMESRKGEPRKPRRRVSHPASAHALAMLTLQPVHATPVPRFHVAPSVPNGNVLVNDRVSNERFNVYTPRFVCQFRTGHCAGLWYFRPVSDVGIAPRSPGFPTARTAVEALCTGSWNRDRQVMIAVLSRNSIASRT
jgi:hypothetical protein